MFHNGTCQPTLELANVAPQRNVWNRQGQPPTLLAHLPQLPLVPPRVEKVTTSKAEMMSLEPRKTGKITTKPLGWKMDITQRMAGVSRCLPTWFAKNPQL